MWYSWQNLILGFLYIGIQLSTAQGLETGRHEGIPIRISIKEVAEICLPENGANCGEDAECVVLTGGDARLCLCSGSDPSLDCQSDVCPNQAEPVCPQGSECQNINGLAVCVALPVETTTQATQTTTTPYNNYDYGGGDLNKYYDYDYNQANYYSPDTHQIDPNTGLWVQKTYYAHSFDENDPIFNLNFTDVLSLSTTNTPCDNEDIICDPTSPYRNIDGSCNNLNTPIAGGSSTAYARFLEPRWEDGTSPFENVPKQEGMPSAREVSNELFDATHNQHFAVRHSLTLMWFGQFLAHDIALTRQHESPENCCNDTNLNDPNCFTVTVPGWDPVFTPGCLHFTRSIYAERGCLPDTGLAILDYNEINNKATHLIDLSMVYGNNETEAESLRNFTGGRLTVKEGAYGQELLPENSHDACPMTSATGYCQLTGDPRVNDVDYLGMSHTLFLRQHNLIADQLAAINPGWDDERLYQEARKILIGLFQNIVYKEFLPEVLGPKLPGLNMLTINETGFQDDYDETVLPIIFNEFVTAAMRFGHSLIPPHLAYLLADYCIMDWYSMVHEFGDSQMLYLNDGANLTEFTRWATYDHVMKADRFIEAEMRNYLNKGDDIGMRNVQRGRDHGLAGYNEFRQFCDLDPIHFDNQFILIDHDYDSSEKLRSLYRFDSDVDLYAGGLSELPRGGSILGPTFTCLLIKQFKKLRISDRFWYEREGQFTEEQLNSIKTVSLSQLTCEAYNLDTIQPNAFVLTNYEHTNAMTNCTSLPALDLSLWYDPDGQ